MVETSLSCIPESYYISKEKIYTRNEKYYKISNIVEKFNAEAFALWMKEGFSNCPVKTQKDLAIAVKSNVATINRLMNGSPQSTNQKPSQPPKDLVKRLATYFEKDINEALTLAGHAPENSLLPAPLEVSDFEGFDEEDLLNIKEYIKFRKSLKTQNNAEP
jgi:bisphosphoglycerate-dependent phosphoglycerate mutase